MTSTRFQEPADGVGWRWPVLVRCPCCDARATLTGGAGAQVRLTCAQCALVREWDGHTLLAAAQDGSVLKLERSRNSGDWLDPRTGRRWTSKREWPSGRDPFFGARLWLQAECCGGRLLWARNVDHLEYVRAFVAGELREDVPGLPFKALSSKLPTWMKEAKHRDEILRHLERLRSNLA